jgi:uncharacterized protein YbjT (DUF2867 family)
MILLTGSTGLSGLKIANEFIRRKTPVRILVRRRSKASAFEGHPYTNVVEADMAYPQTLGAALEGVSVALMSSSPNELMLETQCTFIDACRRAGVAHVVKFSGASAGIGFTENNFRFGRMHGQIERYLEGSGLDWTHLRPSQFMEVYLREARSISSAGNFSLPMGDGRESPIAIKDIAAIAYQVLCGHGHEGKSYVMTGPESLSMSDVAGRISLGIGKHVRYVNIEPFEYRRRLESLGMPKAFVDGLDDLFKERRKCLDSRVALDTHKEFNIVPTSFLDFVLENKAAFLGL